MKFNSDIHHRRSIRLKDYDYSRNGAYFITICTRDRRCYFEEFDSLRQIVEAQWQTLPKRFPVVTLDAYVIMPNHFHGIIGICRDTPCGCPGIDVGDRNQGHPQGVPLQKNGIGEIVGAFKSLCVHAWLKVVKEEKIDTVGTFWQKNYYEHVIRNDDEMVRIRQYVIENPLKWDLDRENPLFKNTQSRPEQWMV